MPHQINEETTKLSRGYLDASVAIRRKFIEKYGMNAANAIILGSSQKFLANVLANVVADTIPDASVDKMAEITMDAFMEIGKVIDLVGKKHCKFGSIRMTDINRG